ncbi:MAG: hypothetical protein AAFV95_02165 [Bacteroidota bacterium]
MKRDHFQNYFDGKMSPEEEEDLTEELVRFTLGEDKKKAWAQRLEKEYGISKTEGPVQGDLSTRRLWLWGLLALVVALLLAALAYSFGKPKADQSIIIAQQLVDELNILQDPTVVKKNFGEQPQVNRLQAVEAYTKGDYAGAVKLYTQLDAKGEADAYDLMYHGVSLLKVGRWKDCLLVLERSSARGGPQGELNWCRALANLMDGQTDLTKEQLRQIVAQQGYMQEAAARLLDQLQKQE